MSHLRLAGIDIGGTNLRIVIETEPGGELAHREERLQHDGPEAVLARTCELLAAMVGDEHLAAIGVAVSGPVDVRTGIVDNPWTLEGWRGIDVRRPFAGFEAPVIVDNDANAAALGEYAYASRQGFQTVAAVTIGTGIGVGLVQNGIIFRGAHDAHPEAGHRSIAAQGPICYCGRVGCWEQLASGSALARAASRSPESVLRDALAGDTTASQLIDQLTHELGRGLRDIESFYAPDLIVLAGGLGASLKPYEARIREGLGPASPLTPRAALSFAHHGDFAGAVGALIGAREQIARRT